MTAHEHARKASEILSANYPMSTSVPTNEVGLATAHALTALALHMPRLHEELTRLEVRLRYVR